MSDILVAKIGGSTLGGHDTALEDIAELPRRGFRPVVVHGGGALISEWLARHNVPTRFESGLRVTDAATLEVVVAVLAGLVNKQIVSSLAALGCRAVGLSGADDGLLRARVKDEKLGLVGEIVDVEKSALKPLLESGAVPVIAPIAQQWQGERPQDQLLNINADTAAGAIASTLGARWLVFLTDVEGVRSSDGKGLSSLTREDAAGMMEAGAIEGGMIPKVEACLEAAASGCGSFIADGRREHALLDIVEGRQTGTKVG